MRKTKKRSHALEHKLSNAAAHIKPVPEGKVLLLWPEVLMEQAPWHIPTSLLMGSVLATIHVSVYFVSLVLIEHSYYWFGILVSIASVPIKFDCGHRRQIC